jgi:hypothetical protein
MKMILRINDRSSKSWGGGWRESRSWFEDGALAFIFTPRLNSLGYSYFSNWIRFQSSYLHQNKWVEHFNIGVL